MQYYQECMGYIQELCVPEGYETDILCIQEAASLAEGYNGGMQASDAKYKVYLRQEMFILNRNFLSDVLSVFEQDEKIGMLGVRGCTRLPSDDKGKTEWDAGNILAYDGWCLKDTCAFLQPADRACMDVEALDGALLVTRQDIPWSEHEKDTYDCGIAQSIAMRKNGYRVVLPYQEQPWCFFDREAVRQSPVNREELAALRNGFIQLMELHAYEELRKITEEGNFAVVQDIQMREIANLLDIYMLEELSDEQFHSEWFDCSTWNEMYAYYRQIRWILLRLEMGKEDERIDELKKLVQKKSISLDAIGKIANIALPRTTNVFQYFVGIPEEPLVSVCMPVYNGEEFVTDTIESVLNQTYRNLEFIIVDDCSTDRSREIIENYEDARIKRIFLEKNRNICGAGNVAFAACTGEYVAAIGHDDIWKPEKLERQVAFLERHKAVGACFTWVNLIDEEKNIINGKESNIYQRFNIGNLTQEESIRRLVLHSNFFCAPSVCMRRAVLEQVGYYRYGLVQLQDYELWLRMLSETPVYILQEKLTMYRRFSEDGKNLSGNSKAVENRYFHERQWILASYVEQMPDESFLKVFQNDLKNKAAISHKEVLCEKAFFLWKIGCCFAEKNFIELLEDEECRNILENEYQFTLNDFYAMNKEPMYFDQSWREKLKKH
jgi:glycosyltransferase involved in cell wall biosynthesis